MTNPALKTVPPHPDDTGYMPDYTQYAGTKAWMPLDWDIVDKMNVPQLFHLFQKLSFAWMLCGHDYHRCAVQYPDDIGNDRLAQVAKESLQSLAMDMENIRQKLKDLGMYA